MESKHTSDLLLSFKLLLRDREVKQLTFSETLFIRSHCLLLCTQKVLMQLTHLPWSQLQFPELLFPKNVRSCLLNERLF